MKKKLAGLDRRIQIGLVVVGLLIVGFVARTFVVSPQNDKAAALAAQIADLETQIATRQSQLRRAAVPTPIETADVFKLAKAMPDREDMPGIILTISQVARETGITFDTIEPKEVAPATAGAYRTRKIHLAFRGDFYALSDFLLRLRSLVTVHDGTLDADGRLFTVDTVTFTLDDDAFPAITADVVVDAYMYGTGVAAVAPTTPTTPTDPGATTTTTPTTTTPAPAPAAAPEGATAVGVTP